MLGRIVQYTQLCGEFWRWSLVRATPGWLLGAEEVVAGVFARHGYEATRMEHLAEAMRVPRATLYYHFSGKDAVLGWLMGSTVGGLGGAVSAAAADPGSAAARLERVIRAMVGVMGRRPAACRVLIANLEQSGRLTEIADGLIAAFHAPVITLLVEGAADGSLRPVTDPIRVASAMFGATAIAGLQSLVVEDVFAEEAVAAAVLDVLLDGLRAS
jgi:TetR/AcrR family transcriptional regulator